MKHNKKRNTAFLYETLLREGTKASLTKDVKRLDTIKGIILEFFNSSTILNKELMLYGALKNPDIDKTLADKFLTEVKALHLTLDKRIIFNEQTKLINTINKTLGPDVYDIFIPHYKELATISQIFSDSVSIKDKILLEKELLAKFDTINESKKEPEIDNLVYKKFVSKFNEKYSGLLNEQKALLTKYVNSFTDEGLELKIFLNEEIVRLNEAINKSLEEENIKSDSRMLEKTKKLLSVLEQFKKEKNVTNEMLESVLKIQQFIHEVKING